MTDNRPVYTPQVLELMARQDEMVTAADLAPIVHMNPGVIIKYAKEGSWTLSEYQISGDRVKFCRMDFLRKMGYVGEEPMKKTRDEMILDELKAIRAIITAIIRKEGGTENEADQSADLA